MRPSASITANAAMPGAILRHQQDVSLIGLAALHGAALVLWPSVWLIALGLWWNANTISHNFIHRPFFRARTANHVFSIYLSLLLGFPQTLWRERHLAHHVQRRWRFRWSGALVRDGIVAGLLWAALCWQAPAFFAFTYLPGLLLGLALCRLQGHFEHHAGTVSHYGRLYNWLFFNDGFHVEHHARPGAHWTSLPQWRPADASGSRWPAVFRWLGQVNLDTLERLVLVSKPLQRFVLRTHERAFRKMLFSLPEIRSVRIIGGGLFPRTALLMQELLPAARLTVIDACEMNLRSARPLLKESVEFVHQLATASWLNAEPRADLAVIPLAFKGDRGEIRRSAGAQYVLTHDWLWQRPPDALASHAISWLLLKRLNLFKACSGGS